VLRRSFHFEKLEDLVVHHALVDFEKPIRLIRRGFAEDIAKIDARRGIGPNRDGHWIGVELFQ
jgi:hypothetical protein